MLEKAANSQRVQFCVANLPPGIKDPGDFAEARRQGAKKFNVTAIRVAFCEEVIDSAQEWSDWYLDRLLRRCDAGATRQMSAGGLGDTFQKVADFLSTFSNPADRTKSASLVAGKMASMIAENSNATKVSKAVRLQLESDLIDLASKKATERELALKRRNELGAESKTALGLEYTLDSSSNATIDVSMLSSKARMKLAGIDSAPSRNSRLPTRKQQIPPLVPHFAGFRFSNPNDADWLGVPRDVVS
jgi:hypothetical protein